MTERLFPQVFITLALASLAVAALRRCGFGDSAGGAAVAAAVATMLCLGSIVLAANLVREKRAANDSREHSE